MLVLDTLSDSNQTLSKRGARSLKSSKSLHSSKSAKDKSVVSQRSSKKSGSGREKGKNYGPPRHIQDREGQKYIIVDQMSPRTKFIYENFNGGSSRSEDGSISVGNLHTLVNYKEHAPVNATGESTLAAPKQPGISMNRPSNISNVSCFPGLSLPKMPSLAKQKDPKRQSVGMY